MDKCVRYARVIAVHEAGHAVAYITLGMEFSRVVRYTSQRAARAARCAGEVVVDEWRMYPTKFEAFSALAGPVAEAKYKKKSLARVILRGGSSDWRKVEKCATWGQLDHDELEQNVRKFVSLHWNEILSVADALMKHCSLTRDEVVKLAPRAYEIWETRLAPHFHHGAA